ncbi:enoyl-CoA hydratase/isomerase family protein [Streptomyces sp. NPDC093018]|uniref:enoyl-CoA hydratase/isomerase family protein n=1 Tax=Streptomyces sp. NPDC093018 TaxID=3155067 RepID=UPI0034164DFD
MALGVDGTTVTGTLRDVAWGGSTERVVAAAETGAGTGGLGPRASAAAVYEQAFRIFRLEIPVLAAVQGAAVGGGLGLACAAGFRVAGPKSRFAANFSRLGFPCGFALSLTLPRIAGQTRAELMLYTGRALRGQEAYAAGLADRFAELGEERAAAVELARELAAAAPLAVRSMRATLHAGLLDRLEAARARARRAGAAVAHRGRRHGHHGVPGASRSRVPRTLSLPDAHPFGHRLQDTAFRRTR